MSIVIQIKKRLAVLKSRLRLPFRSPAYAGSLHSQRSLLTKCGSTFSRLNGYTPHVTEKLPLWVSGDLSEQEMLSVQAHLDSCPACSSEAQAYSETLSWLREPVEAPFTQEELLAVRNSVMAKIRKPEVSNARRFMPWLLAAAASIPAAMMFYASNGSDISEEKSAPKTIVASAKPDAPTVSQQIQQINAVSSDVAQTQPLLEQAAHRPAKRSAHLTHAKSQPAGLEHETSVTRIEFQTENPNIRIIWFPRSNSSTDDLTYLTDLADFTNH